MSGNKKSVDSRHTNTDGYNPKYRFIAISSKKLKSTRYTTQMKHKLRLLSYIQLLIVTQEYTTINCAYEQQR